MQKQKESRLVTSDWQRPFWKKKWHRKAKEIDVNNEKFVKIVLEKYDLGIIEINTVWAGDERYKR